MAPAAKRTRVALAAAEVAAPRRRAKLEAVPRGRVRLDTSGGDEGLGQASTYSYFADPEKEGIEFVSAGCAVFDAMCGGGYPRGRVINIVGDKSAGKTLLTMEAFANFHQQWPDDPMRYGEAEHAFDAAYADAIGIPMDVIELAQEERDAKGNRVPFRTVQDFAEDLERFCDRIIKEKRSGGIYAVDSLDALSEDAELERSAKLAKQRARDRGEDDDDDDRGGKAAGTYGAEKAKQMSEMFRRLVDKIEEANVLLIVVSQLREAIGVRFGDKYRRSGGRALDYYASIVVWVRDKGRIKRTIDKVERVIGIDVHARVKKNKVGLPFRECEYPILFGYGIDDLTADAEWLLEVGREKALAEVGMSKDGYKVRIANLRNKGGEHVREVRANMRRVVFREWQSIEQGFLPRARKY